MEQVFSTSEGILAFCLYMAGAQLPDPKALCFNIYDPDNLSKAGYKGTRIWDAANQAWQSELRGHVEYAFCLSQRTHDLIKIYREQREEHEKSDAKASELVLEIMSKAAAGAMLPDEAILRISCVNMVLRGEFFNAWKQVVPLLKIPEKGQSKTFDTSVTIRDQDGSRSVPAKGVRKPGFKLISLNASEETKRKLKLI